jgi:hypothetical protein
VDDRRIELRFSADAETRFYGAQLVPFTVVMGWSPLPRARPVGREADCLRSLESNLRKEWRYTCTSPHVCLAWCLVMERENHIFAVQLCGVNVPF